MTPCLDGEFGTDFIHHRPVFTLHEVPTNRFLCPVSYFLALAFFDNAFDQVSDVSMLKKLDVPTGRTSLILAYNSSKADLPIFRAQKSCHALSETRIWTTDKVTTYLHELGIHAGYGQLLSMYNFRRGQAQMLDG